MLKKVEVREGDLVNVIANIVEETVEARKVEWLAEAKTQWIKESRDEDANALSSASKKIESKTGKKVKLINYKNKVDRDQFVATFDDGETKAYQVK